MKFRNLIGAALCAAAVVGMTPAHAQNYKPEYKLSIVVGTTFPWGQGAEIWSKLVRERNGFDWEPIREVAKLFAAIFLTIIPVIAILKAGANGALAPLVALVTGEGGEPFNAGYFWMTGLLSGFLDNAPTYLVFFNLAGGEPQELMTTHAVTLEAISAGAVFMGALTYIGNAPNFMVLAIAKSRGVAMPSFFGYMAWSGLFLLPCFALLTWLYFL